MTTDNNINATIDSIKVPDLTHKTPINVKVIDYYAERRKKINERRRAIRKYAAFRRASKYILDTIVFIGCLVLGAFLQAKLLRVELGGVSLYDSVIVWAISTIVLFSAYKYWIKFFAENYN